VQGEQGADILVFHLAEHVVTAVLARVDTLPLITSGCYGCVCVSIVPMLSLPPQKFVWLRQCCCLLLIRQNPSSGCRAEICRCGVRSHGWAILVQDRIVGVVCCGAVRNTGDTAQLTQWLTVRKIRRNLNFAQVGIVCP